MDSVILLEKGGMHVKRLLLVVFVGLFALAGIGQAQPAKKPPGNGDKKVTICHRTGSETKPYVKIRVSKNALKKGHARHAGDIIPAPEGGCPSQPMSATQGGTVLTATLTGTAEVPGPGDPDGSGQATIRLTAGEARVCFQLSASNITLPATAAHIHAGAAGSAGGIVAPLSPPDASGVSQGCAVISRPLANAILTNPSAYYVNVHTSDFPDGAIRGQLAA
jgi:CHRD domain